MKQVTFNSDIFSFSVGMTYPKTCFNEKVEESREKVFLLSWCIIILYLIQQGNVNFKAKIQIIQGSSMRFPSHFSISFATEIQQCSYTATVPDQKSISGDLIIQYTM